MVNSIIYRICGNWLTSFLSPLMGSATTVILIPDDWGLNIKILLTALISSSIVTGLVIAREFERRGKRR